MILAGKKNTTSWSRKGPKSPSESVSSPPTHPTTVPVSSKKGGSKSAYATVAAEVTSLKDQNSKLIQDAEHTAAQLKEAIKLKNYMESRIKQLEERIDQEKQKWTKEKMNLVTRVARLKKSVKTSLTSKFIGRNKICKSSYTGYDFSNIGSIITFLKFEIQPHVKFWPSSWKKWTPYQVGTLCAQIIRNVDMPEDQDPESYWSTRLTGIINTKLIYWRSQVVQRVCEQYKGKSSLFDHLSFWGRRYI